MVDVLTNNEIIEIKNWNSYKFAIGQIISYSYFYPNLQKRLHFFGKKPKEIIFNFIKLVCEKHNINLTFE